MATSQSYTEFLKDYPDAFILAVTATPYGKKSMSHVADVIVKPITMLELIEQGFLVPPRYFAPTTPDLRDVKTSASTGDYIQDQLNKVMDTSTLTGDIVDHWVRIGERRKTICFAVSVEHSKHIAEKFNQAGIVAEHCDAETPDLERKAILKRLETGATNVVSNVGILCTGVDLPYVSCLIMARPTKSYNLFIQQAGRGTRPCEGKADFIILDHAGNVCRHGFITSEREAFIEPACEPAPRGGQRPRVCGSCYAVFAGSECPQCGAKITAHQGGEREIDSVDGALNEVVALTEEQQIKIFIQQQKDIAKRRGYKRGWVYYKLIDRYGQEVADQYMPKRVIPEWVRRRMG